MKENVKKELEALIQEQKDRIPKLKCEVGAFAYYVYEPSVKERSQVQHRTAIPSAGVA